MVHSVYNCSVSTLHPHRLSYFLIILALGVCVDQRRSHQSWVRDAERYHSLARAALCENSVIDEPSVDAINWWRRSRCCVERKEFSGDVEAVSLSIRTRQVTLETERAN